MTAQLVNVKKPLYSAERRGPMLVVAGLGIVILAQALPGIPVAAAIALIGWGSALMTDARTTSAARRPRLVLFAGVYAPLTALTAAAQFHLAMQQDSALGQTAAAMDAAVSVTLVGLLLRWTVDRLTEPQRVDR